MISAEDDGVAAAVGSSATKDIAFGSVSGTSISLAFPGLPLIRAIRTHLQVAGMTSKLFEHPFDLGEPGDSEAGLLMQADDDSLQSRFACNRNLQTGQQCIRVRSTASSERGVRKG